MICDQLPPVTIEELARTLPIHSLNQAQINWLLRQGVMPLSIVTPEPIYIAPGSRADGGFFYHQKPDDPKMPGWLALQPSELEFADIFYWHPASRIFAWEFGYRRGFALGQDILENPGATALGQAINIYADVMTWLKAGREGLVIVDWDQAHARLRHVGHVAVDPAILALYKFHMPTTRLPRVSVLSTSNITAVAS